MSISLKVYGSGLRIKRFLGTKTFQSSLIAFLSVLMFFGTFNIYAQEGISPEWEGTKRFHNIISGTDGEEDNMNSMQGLEILNSGWAIFSIMVPEATQNADKVLSDSKIPNDLKRGVLGMAEDASYAAYASYPSVDVGKHLAQQWVPGYQESVTSLYAQSSSAGHESGYSELMGSGIVKLWNRVLNIAYVAFVVVMIAAGFMIMFRHKLGGQTMVTIGNVLPGVITALIIATFSFAIAGLIIDFGGVLTSIVVFILKGSSDLNIHSTSNIYTLMIGAFGNVLNDLGKLSPVHTGVGVIDKVLDLSAIVIGIVGTVATVGIPLLILGLITAGVVFVGAVKVLIVLFKAYFNILLNTIIGPVQIALSALPGNGHMLQNWFTSILRNVLVFPLVLAIINIPNAIVAATDGDFDLKLPEKLTYDQNQGIFETLVPNLGLNIGGGFVMVLFRIFILYFAAQAPKFLEAWLPPNTPKPVGEAMVSAKGSLSKVPLIGTLFK
ncbi:MAG: hypothetical protein RBT33_00505 [Candidatus Dojkabacteria bacterium]|jgi:hypothetical protein|nr:hypothetical protein [Candidatus Dojkabacteria bacterium]